MNGWKKAVIAAVILAAAGACGRADGIAAPDAARFDEQAPPPADTAADATAETDSTGGRWGGFLGSGT